jgi:hypothetical protein
VRQSVADAGDARQQRRGRRVDVYAHGVDAILDHRIEGTRKFVFAQIVLILAHADRSGINLDQLSERVLKPPEKGAAMPDLGDPAWRGMVCVETGNVADDRCGSPPVTSTKCRH